MSLKQKLNYSANVSV